MYVYVATDNTPNLRLIRNKFHTVDLTIDETKDEQRKMQEKFDELKTRDNPKKDNVKNENNESMEQVTENAEDLYKTRNYLISTLEGVELEELDKELKFNWLHSPESKLKKLRNNIDIDSDLESHESTKFIKKKCFTFFKRYNKW